MITKFLSIIAAILLFTSQAYGAACDADLSGGIQSCNIITKHGITWTLSANVTVGQFIKKGVSGAEPGDYFVVDPGAGVVVSSVSPAAFVSGNDYHNGSQKNPTVAGKQALDKTVSAGEINFDATLKVTFPVTLNGGDCLISSISRTTTGETNWAGKTITHIMPRLTTVEVLTVLSSAPANPAITFRPAMTDRGQTLFTTATINTDFLPDLPTTGMPTPTAAYGTWSTISEYFERGTARPWIVWGNDWLSRAIHPLQNMYDYHGQVGDFLSLMSTMLMSDYRTTAMTNGFLQVAIDYYPTHCRDSACWATPVIIGGLILDQSDMYNYWIDHPSYSTQREHEKLYYIGDVTESRNSSIVPEGKTWTEWATSGGKYPAFRKQIGEEYEHLHPSEWTCYEPDCKAEVYRDQFDVYPLVGMVLSTIIADQQTALDVNAMIRSAAVRDYVDRWMYEGFRTTQYKSTGRTFYEEMQYYKNIQFAYLRYDTSGSGFSDAMWDTYRDASATCSTVASMCTTSGDCTTAGWNWCTDTCQSDPCGWPPATLSNPYPTSSLAAGTTQVTITVDSSETCTAKYDTTSGTAYASMPNTFSTTGGTSHSQLITGLTDSSSTPIYIRTSDADGNISDEYTITINVLGVASCDASHWWLCPADATCTAAGGYPWNGLCNKIAKPVDIIDTPVVANWNFSAWTSGLPDSWIIPDSVDPAHATIADDTGSMLMQNDGVSWAAIRQDFPLSGSGGDGKQYRYVLTYWGTDVSVYTENEQSTDYTESGSYTGIITNSVDSARVYLNIPYGTASTVNVSQFVVYEITAAAKTVTPMVGVSYE